MPNKVERIARPCEHCGEQVLRTANLWGKKPRAFCNRKCWDDWNASPQKFWSKVLKGADDECWEWAGACHPFGHGQVCYGGKVLYAHRVSYEFNIGPIPEGMTVMHLCDNPKCVNPAHLQVGTQAENLKHMRKHGRGFTPPHRSESVRNKNSKLNPDKVRKIRELHANSDLEICDIANRYGVSASCITGVVYGRTWKHVA